MCRPPEVAGTSHPWEGSTLHRHVYQSSNLPFTCTRYACGYEGSCDGRSSVGPELTVRSIRCACIRWAATALRAALTPRRLAGRNAQSAPCHPQVPQATGGTAKVSKGAALRMDRRASTADQESSTLHEICSTIAAEFAQPLSGILIYSELLLRNELPADRRLSKEISGVREGALQMEQLLSTLRDVLAATAAVTDSEEVAAAIALALTHPHPRILVAAY
jgi:signal transduction histidine kinase